MSGSHFLYAFVQAPIQVHFEVTKNFAFRYSLVDTYRLVLGLKAQLVALIKLCLSLAHFFPYSVLKFTSRLYHLMANR